MSADMDTPHLSMPGVAFVGSDEQSDLVRLVAMMVVTASSVQAMAQRLVQHPVMTTVGMDRVVIDITEDLGGFASVADRLLSAATDLMAILHGGDLAAQFPDGGPAPALRVMTRKQFNYLHNIATRMMPPPKKRCAGTTQKGNPCSRDALRWGEEGMCQSHASRSDIEVNRQMHEAVMSQRSAWVGGDWQQAVAEFIDSLPKWGGLGGSG